MDSEEEEEEEEGSNSNSGFDCNICLDSVQDPVVTLCGHLYCWPCIYRWLNCRGGGGDIDGDDVDEEEYDKPSHRQCPVCKFEITESALVPLFGRGQAGDDVSSGRTSSPAGGSKSAPPPRLRRGYYEQRPPPMMGGGAAGLNLDLSGRVPIPVVGMLGEIVFSGGFGNGIYGYQNTAAPVAGGGSPRVRRQLMEADRSLSRVCFFLFCCLFMCILLF
ncbi:unnamed protein product [Linum tenue]|uniref:E3 ubiquitin-protein ligase RMA n=1 Tax=Linum tenue TaxID=586396 RepID=A0AAV0QZP1_9ROSI|nr:unnamed protein product [Linum tenue]